MRRDDSCLGCGPPLVHSGLRGFGSFGDPGTVPFTMPALGNVPTPMLIGAAAGFLFGGKSIVSAAMGAALGYFISKGGMPQLPGQGLTTATLPGGGPVGSPMPPISGGGLVDTATSAWAALQEARAQAAPAGVPGIQGFGDDVDTTQPDESGGQWWMAPEETDAQWCPVEDEESMIEQMMSAEEDASATDALVHARGAPPAGG